jgi:hypothetical protein
MRIGIIESRLPSSLTVWGHLMVTQFQLGIPSVHSAFCFLLPVAEQHNNAVLGLLLACAGQI